MVSPYAWHSSELSEERLRENPENVTMMKVLSLGDEEYAASGMAGEATVRWWQQRAKTYRKLIEEAYGIVLTGNDLSRRTAQGYAAEMTNAYRRRADSRTANEAAFGSSDAEQEVEVAATAMFKENSSVARSSGSGEVQPPGEAMEKRHMGWTT